MPDASTTERSDVASTCRLCGCEVGPPLRARWQKDGFDIIECPGCGLLARRDLPTDDELPEIYAESYFRRPEDGEDAQGYLDYLADEETHLIAARKRLERLDRWTGPPGRLLDVGCASGFFLAEARERGWHIEGVDVSAAMAAAAGERFGLRVRTATFADVEVDGPFDCVTMWDYLEHAVDPVGDARRAAGLLRPGGVLALSTGDAGSLSARVAGSRWHLLTPRHHNFFFRRRDVRRVLGAAGLEVVEDGAWARWASIGYLLYKLGVVAPRSRVVSRLARAVRRRRIGSVVVPVNLLDVMTVVARKPSASPRRG